MAARLFAVVRSLFVAALFVSLWTWFLPRWIAAGKNVPLELHLGWPLVLIVIGGLIDLRCFLDFAWQGLGTPAPFDPPRRFVAVGFYRWVRNPMYLGFALVLIGEALLLPSITTEMLIMLAILAVTVWAFVVFYEEPHLHELFGEEYDRYRGSVRRWLPKLTPYGQSG